MATFNIGFCLLQKKKLFLNAIRKNSHNFATTENISPMLKHKTDQIGRIRNKELLNQ